eukprot:5919157-Pleurochrysis_carterae.AAC.1
MPALVRSWPSSTALWYTWATSDSHRPHRLISALPLSPSMSRKSVAPPMRHPLPPNSSGWSRWTPPWPSLTASSPATIRVTGRRLPQTTAYCSAPQTGVAPRGQRVLCAEWVCAAGASPLPSPQRNRHLFVPCRCVLDGEDVYQGPLVAIARRRWRHPLDGRPRQVAGVVELAILWVAHLPRSQQEIVRDECGRPPPSAPAWCRPSRPRPRSRGSAEPGTLGLASVCRRGVLLSHALERRGQSASAALRLGGDLSACLPRS